MLVATESVIEKPEKSESAYPLSAFVFYGHSPCSFTAVTRHKIINGQLSSAELLRPEQFHDYILQSTNNIKSKSLAPQKVLKETQNSIVWHTNRQTRMIWFRTPKGTQNFLVEYPPLFWVAAKDGSKCHVMALSANTRPTGKSRLYTPCLMNISTNGALCQGTARLPRKLTVDTLDEAESALFDSCFSHVNNGKTFKVKGKKKSEGVSNDEHIAFWKEKSKSKGRIKASDLHFYSTVDKYLEGAL